VTSEEAAKELMAMLEEAQEGPYYSEEEVRAHLLEILDPHNHVYMTGDTHGQFERVVDFCAHREVEPENTFVILDDAGLNYYNFRRDRKENRNPAHVEYDRAYNRLKQKRLRKKISVNEWNAAVAEAMRIRELAESGQLTDDEMRTRFKAL